MSLGFLLMLQLFTFNVWRSRRNLGPGGLLPILLDTVQRRSAWLAASGGPPCTRTSRRRKRKAIWWARADPGVSRRHSRGGDRDRAVGAAGVLSLFPFIGNWWAHFVGLPMHAGLRDNVTDFRKCVRSITLDPFSEFIYWHMNWHRAPHVRRRTLLQPVQAVPRNPPTTCPSRAR